MWALNMMKTRNASNKDSSNTTQAEQQQPRKKRSSEEDTKVIQKRAALTDVTNKTQGRVTRAQAKKELESSQQQSLLCFESSSHVHSHKNSSPLSPIDRMFIDGMDANVHPDDASHDQDKSEWDLIPHEDIDANDNDPQLCKVYVNEIYEYLRENEVKYHAADYMPFQKEINANMRAILVDWLLEVAEEYKLSSETLYLGVRYLDRYLSKKSVARRELQLVGVACMLLASKYEEIYAPSVDEFVYISDNTYSKEEVFTMEANILDVLEFSLTVATIKNFLRRYLKAAYANHTVNMFANYLCELALHEYCFVRYLPSVVAVSALYLAQRSVTPNAPLWTPTLEHYTHHRPTDPVVRQCVLEMHAMHKATPRNYTAACDEKYADAQFLKVSNQRMVPPAAALHL